MPLYLALRQSGDRRSVLTGIVVSRDTSSLTAVVDTSGDGDRVTAPYVGAAPSVGDVAVLIRSAQRLWLLGTYGAATQPVPPEPDPTDPEPDPDRPPPPPTTITTTLTPKATGTARGGSVRGDTRDLYQGDWTGRGVNSGQAVYRAKQLTGTVTKVRLRVKRLDAGSYAAQTPTLRLMTQSSLTGSPSWQASTAGPALKVGDSRTVTLPNSWGQKLITGQAGGIGVHVAGASPYIRIASGSMQLTLTIRK